jgi:hypothetical protein
MFSLFQWVLVGTFSDDVEIVVADSQIQALGDDADLVFRQYTVAITNYI